jgi:hypothetical protein
MKNMRHGGECIQLFATLEAAEAAVVEWHNTQFNEPPVTTAGDAIDSAASYDHYVFILTPEMQGGTRIFA